MKITDYINALDTLRKEHGDLDVWQTGSESIPDLANYPEIGYLPNNPEHLRLDGLSDHLTVNARIKVIVIPGLLQL